MSNRLFVGNLTFQTTEDDLLQAFQDFGAVAEVKVVTDRETGRSRGFAFVEMADQDGAQKATEAMNGAMFDGRPLRVNEAEERRDRPSGGGGGGGFRPRNDGPRNHTPRNDGGFGKNDRRGGGGGNRW